MKRKALKAVGAIVFACLAGAASAQSQSPISLVVPFGAGGPSDVLARITAQKMSEYLGQTIVVENKPGATGGIGTRHVAQSKPDGRTLLLASSSSMTTGPLLAPEIKFDPVNDFIPIGLIANDEIMLTVHPTLPVHSAKEFVEYAKSRPGELSYSTSGVGSAYHLATEEFSSLLGIEMIHVPYGGTAQAVNDFLAGTVQMQLQAISQGRPHYETGKLRPLAVLSLEGNPRYPDMPVLAEELDLPGFHFSIWMGIFAPAATPADEVERLRDAMQKALASDEVRERILAQGFSLIDMTPEQIKSQISSDLNKWAGILKRLDIIK